MEEGMNDTLQEDGWRGEIQRGGPYDYNICYFIVHSRDRDRRRSALTSCAPIAMDARGARAGAAQSQLQAQAPSCACASAA